MGLRARQLAYQERVAKAKEAREFSLMLLRLEHERRERAELVERLAQIESGGGPR